MNTNEYKKPVILGIFIFIGLLIFIAGVFTIGSQKKIFDRKFSLAAVFDDVDGLQSGNNVWLSGVKIGTVKKVEFSGNTQVRITLNIERTAKPHINRDARVKISTDGFIGNKIVVIYGGTAAAGEVEDGETLLAEKGVSLEDMMATLQLNNRNLLAITGNVKNITQTISSGKGTLGGLIYDSSVLDNLAATLQNIKRASQKGEGAIARLSDFSHRLDTSRGLVNRLINDTGTYENIRLAVMDFKQTAAKTSLFMDSLQLVSRALNDSSGPVGVLLRDKKLARDFQILVGNLKSGSQKLDEDLEALQHNFLFRGFFKSRVKGKSN